MHRASGIMSVEIIARFNNSTETLKMLKKQKTEIDINSKIDKNLTKKQQQYTVWIKIIVPLYNNFETIFSTSFLKTWKKY